MIFKNLPGKWKISECKNRVIISAFAKDGHSSGAVTIDFIKRNFAFGDSIVQRKKFNRYNGRGWRDALIKDAIEELKKAVG